MAITLKPAVNYIKPMKVLSYGPTYSGKTLSSLNVAVGIVQSIRKCTEAEAYKHIVMIDTEYGRGALYNKLGPYNYLSIEAPYWTEKLSNMILELNTMDEIDVIIIDSLSHFWAKEGGILEQKNEADKKGGNSYTNWADYTAKFNRMLDTIMSSPKHILVTARAKSDTVLVTNDKGKSVPVSYGLKPELRDGVDFEFDIVFNVDKLTHTLVVDKGVPGMDPFYELATNETGKHLYDVFNVGKEARIRTVNDVAESIRNFSRVHNLIQFVQLKLSGRNLNDLELDKLLELENEIKEKIKRDQR